MGPTKLDDFLGLWRVERQIEDFRAGERLRFTGQVHFSPGAGGLVYDETGTLHTAQGVEMTATRRYLWQEAGAGIAVSFEDGRAFHRIDLSGADPEASHFCDPDTYDVTYDFSQWPDWRATWRVRGPRKDYEMISRYSPQSP